MHSSLPQQLRNVAGLKAGLGQWLARLFERWLVRSADAIVASRGLASRVLAIAPEKVVGECYFNGYEPRGSDKDLPGCFRVNGHPRVVYCGTFASYQGLDLLIEAAAIVCAKIPGVRFLFIGGTKFDIPDLKQLVERRDGYFHLIIELRHIIDKWDHRDHHQDDQQHGIQSGRIPEFVEGEYIPLKEVGKK